MRKYWNVIEGFIIDALDYAFDWIEKFGPRIIFVLIIIVIISQIFKCATWNPNNKTKGKPQMNQNLTSNAIVKQELDTFNEIVVEFMSVDVVIGDNNAQLASDYLRQMKLLINHIDEQRKKIKKPIMEAGRELDSQYRETIAPIEVAIAQLTAGLKTYQIELRRKEAETIRLAAEQEAERLAAIQKEQIEQVELNESDLAMDDAIATGEQIENIQAVGRDAEQHAIGRVKEAGGLSSSGLQDRYKFRVKDIGKIPPMYLIANESMIKKVINGKGRLTEIPGLEIYNDPILRTMGRR